MTINRVTLMLIETVIKLSGLVSESCAVGERSTQASAEIYKPKTNIKSIGVVDFLPGFLYTSQSMDIKTLNRFRRVRQVIFRAHKIGPRERKNIFRQIENLLDEREIQISQTSANGFRLFGIERDITYDSMVSGQFREPHFQEIIEFLLKEDDNCLDLGANLGSHTFLMSRRCNRGFVYAFEPQSLVFQLLSLNILMNRLNNVLPINLAIDCVTGKEVGIEGIYKSAEHINSGYSRIDESRVAHRTLTIAIDDLSLPKISFVKMDIQGSELFALRGMQKMIERDKPVIFFELEEVHLSFRNTSASELLNELFAHHYMIYRIENGYPSDHLAIPIEQIDDFRVLISNSQIEKNLTKINK